MLEEGSSVILRDAGGFCRVVAKLEGGTLYRVGRMTVAGNFLFGRRWGETIAQSGSEWMRCRPTRILGAGEGFGDSSEPENDKEDDLPSRAESAALNSSTFSDKTRFSQEKYLLKKHKKYSKEITLLEPTIPLLCELSQVIHWDAIALLLRLGNTRGKVLIYDDATGLAVAAFLQRGSHVTRIVASKGSNSFKSVQDLGIKCNGNPNLQELRLSDDKLSKDSFNSFVCVFTGNAPGVTLDTLIEKGIDMLSDECGNFALYVRHFEEASAWQKKLRTYKNFLNVNMTEILTREHQIMPDRTHPLMQSSVQLLQGFIVSAFKVKL